MSQELNLIDRLLLPENLYFAWLKAKRLFEISDGYIDRGEIAEFELNIEARLNKIRRKLKSGRYRTSKLRLLPRPKKLKDGKPVDRQFYHIGVDDQVAWIALVNAIGPKLDENMPSWSYGNRLYRPAWYEQINAKTSKLEIGPYRHSSGHLYRKFQHSWPLFRRHISLTARTMASRKLPKSKEIDEKDKRALSTAETEKLRYLSEGYWANAPKLKDGILHYASIDLEKFYPNLNLGLIQSAISQAFTEDEDHINCLLSRMLNFRVDKTEVIEDIICNVEPPYEQGRLSGLPTGLFVAGFLANVAMKNVDYKVDQKLNKNNAIAHFRFVDDHTILSSDFTELCKWISWYEKLLKTENVGPRINSEKYDPSSLGKWMDHSTRKKSSGSVTKCKRDTAFGKAVIDTSVKGKNPSKLMTTTLAQVSAIAAGDIHILDDEDIQERLKTLERLLLADIPEREIRKDTRVTFAVGQITLLACAFIQDERGLVNKARKLACYRKKHSTEEREETSCSCIAKLTSEVCNLQKQQAKSERQFYSRCFNQIYNALLENPGKPRLFFRVLQFCRYTGYSGLPKIRSWLKKLQKEQNSIWAKYYSGLTLQLLSQNAIRCAKILTTRDSLRLERKAAKNHLYDISSNWCKKVLDEKYPEAWFHNVARNEFGISMLVAGKIIEESASAEVNEQKDELTELSLKLSTLAERYTGLTAESSHEQWLSITGRSPGVWAFMYETSFPSNDAPSAPWKMFSSAFSLSSQNDAVAERWYPETMSDSVWNHFLNSEASFSTDEAGWVKDAINNDNKRSLEASSSQKRAFTYASKSLRPLKDAVTLTDWIKEVSKLSPFDPRAGEWTAFEIIRQLIARIYENKEDQEILDRLHPHNVLIPRKWLDDLYVTESDQPLNWLKWRMKSKPTNKFCVTVKKKSNSIFDYRFAGDRHSGMKIHDWDRRLGTVGLLLLCLLRKKIELPRIWNIRGHDKVYNLPRTQWFQTLKVSSRSLLLIEACISNRSAETRAIWRQPLLFGNKQVKIRNGKILIDSEFDPPRIDSLKELLSEIEEVQKVLEKNQLSVSMNQPRQLTPFRLSDFGVGKDKGDTINEF